MNVTVLFDRPQQSIAALLRSQIAASVSVQSAVGFATVEGIDRLASALAPAPGKLSCLVLGAGTYRGFEALDSLIANGVPPSNLFVHLGHTRIYTGPQTFHKYHPMLHSKVHLLEMPHGRAVAFVGSHNLTGFALGGLNGEASVMLEGAGTDPELQKVRDHIDVARRQAVQYSPAMKSAYRWWTEQFLEGLKIKVSDEPRDAEGRRTILILAAAADGIPRVGEVIYFELPRRLEIAKLHADIHIYIFNTPPASPFAALSSLRTATLKATCKTIGLELKRGGRELEADWQIANPQAPMLTRTPRPFRPQPPVGVQQVRAQIAAVLDDEYEYLFESARREWLPVYGEEDELPADINDGALGASLPESVAHELKWRLVTGLTPRDGQLARVTRDLAEVNPDAGRYVLLSVGRVNRTHLSSKREP